MHGFPDNLHLYDRLVPYLSPTRRVITFDFLGWGSSDKPLDCPYTASNQEGDLDAVIQQLNLGQVVFVAHDASGPPAIDWALHHSEQVASLVLLNTYYSVAAVLLVIWRLKQIAQDQIDWLPALSIVAGVTLGLVFLRRQRTLASPLIDLPLFRVPAFSAVLVIYMLATFVAFGVYVFMAQYLQLLVVPHSSIANRANKVDCRYESDRS